VSEGYLTIQWLGQSCFLLVGGEGVRLLIDPVGPEFGYHLPLFSQLDALLISHLHPDHTYTQAVTGGTPNYVGLDSAGHFQAIQQQIKTVAIRSVAAFHDLGDLGQPQLTEQQVRELGHPDVLMIPVGGTTTIDGLQARGILTQLQPKLVLPMHYRTDRTPANEPLAPVDDFIGRSPSSPLPNVLKLKKSDLPADQPGVLVMNYK
jgi:L-ascorbate metabolism protein UlaG (beta-lactamase superfamily)